MSNASPAERIPLPHCPRELRVLTGCPVLGGYPRIYKLVLAGTIPAEQENGRWYLNRNDLPLIASSLGMTAAPTPANQHSAAAPVLASA